MTQKQSGDVPAKDGKSKGWGKVILTYSVIIAITLLAVDGVCYAFGLFPPTYNRGDPDMGWRPSRATGAMTLDKCLDFETGKAISYRRNEDGVRTNLSRTAIAADSGGIRIAVTGDSHTDLCAPNEQTHSGVLESELAKDGIGTTVLEYGAGRHSPLQQYLAFRTVLRPYRPKVLVMNVYTGNDFYDILRVDDRPHLVPDGSGYRIAPPIWYTLDDPKVEYRSRVLFAFRSLADKIGIRPLYLRLLSMRRLQSEQKAGISTAVAYTRDLMRAREPSLWYPDAFTAQMLNQQLYFHYFPGSREESVRRVTALMQMVRAENPGLILVMSPLPSYQLVGEQPVDSALTKTLQRLPIDYAGGVNEEHGLYDQLKGLAAEQQWIFVDNLKVLQAYRGPERLFNKYDYHLLPPASAIIGQAQAAALRDTLRGSPH